MNLIINGKAAHSGATTLDELLRELNLDEAVVATALNGQFVPKTLRQQTLLHAGDQIEIIAPMQGG